MSVDAFQSLSGIRPSSYAWIETEERRGRLRFNPSQGLGHLPTHRAEEMEHPGVPSFNPSQGLGHLPTFGVAAW